MELSKTFLVLIESLGLGALGLDRLYAGCTYTGMFKLALFLTGVFMTYVNEWFGAVILSAWLLFVMYDYIIVFVNTLAGSRCNPFCNADVTWTDIGPAAWVLAFIIVIDIALVSSGIYFFGPLSLFIGPDLKEEDGHSA